MTTQPIIEIKGLHKEFGSVKAVRGVDFTVNQGAGMADGRFARHVV